MVQSFADATTLLTDDCLLHIFAQLTLNEQFVLKQVCNTWHYVIQEMLHSKASQLTLVVSATPKFAYWMLDRESEIYKSYQLYEFGKDRGGFERMRVQLPNVIEFESLDEQIVDGLRRSFPKVKKFTVSQLDVSRKCMPLLRPLLEQWHVEQLRFYCKYLDGKLFLGTGFSHVNPSF